MTSGNLSGMHFTAKNNPEHFKSCLQELSYSPWQNMNIKTFEKNYNGIQNSIKDSGLFELSQLFELYLITKSLLDRNRPSWVDPFIFGNINIEQYLGINAEQLAGSSWQVVPVLLAEDNSAHIRLFIVGRLTCEPDPGLIPAWAESLFDQDFLESASTALELTIGQPANQTINSTVGHFMFYPLTLANKQVQFKGRSGSLALALGFKCLLEGMPPISNKVICTGVVQANGVIRKVGGLDAKYEIFHGPNAYNCLLYPASNRLNAPDNNPDNKKINIPVKTFDQAWMFSSLYTEAHQNKLFLLTKILDDPKYFTDNLKNLPGEWVSWINQEKKAGNILYNIVHDPALLIAFTEKFESIVEHYGIDQAAAISKLMTDSMLEHIDTAAPMSALRWYTSNLSLANHLGEVKQSLAWENRGMALVDQVKKRDITLVATFFNHCLVASHDRFEFTPDLPNTLKEILESLQTEYRNKCNSGCTMHPILGKLYGTLMQHYAFCGPEYILKSEDYSEKALAALGVNLDDEHKPDWMRQYSYLTYARLDARDFAGAAKSLDQYLEMSETDSWFSINATDGIDPTPPINSSKKAKEALSFLDKLSCWELGLVCRFFAQVKDHPFRQTVYEQMVSLNHKIETRHPWQLYTYNLGRIALDLGDKKNARHLLEESRRICLSSKSGPTIRVMALLPLSLLDDLYEQTRNNEFCKIMDQSKKEILEASRQLDSSHFAFLQEISFENALVKVKEKPGSIFPFSYR